MQKKGQLTIAIILGIIMLISIVFVFKVRSSVQEDVYEEIKRQVQGDPQKLALYIQTCLDTISGPIIKEASENGGLINLSDRHKRTYLDEVYPYHCSYTDEVGCQSNLYTRAFIEDQISKTIEDNLSRCIDLTIFKEIGFQVEESIMEVEATIGIDDVIINLNYPVELKKEEIHISFQKINNIFLSDLGYMIDLSNDIINKQIEEGFFDKASFIRRNSDVKIEVHKPYPDIVFKITKYNQDTNEDLIFRFAIEGFDTAENRDVPAMNPSEEIIGYCATPDGNCYINPRDIELCTSNLLKGTFHTSKPDCINPSNPLENQEDLIRCQGKSCKPCGIYNHGDSWCIYDGVVGGGWDFPGTRHYQKTCYDGKVYTEECRDYREEICTEKISEKHAICRINRWDDCILQNTRKECEDDSKRDCIWQEKLKDNNIKSFGVIDSERLCHPQVPPGIKHWTESGSKLCDMGSEIRTCDGLECPSSWSDMNSLRCSFQGDCGIARNRLDRLSMEGFMSPNTVNKKIREGIGYVETGFTDGPLKSYTGRYHLELPLFPDKSIDKTKIIYENPKHNLLAYKNEVDKFVKEAQTWKLPCDFCDCIFGVPIGNCVYDKQTPFGAFCDVWQSPVGEMRCEFCNKDSEKPCSEYLCYSLGAPCQFIDSDGDGIGICLAPDTKDRKGPKIKLKSLNSNYSYEEYFDVFTGLEGLQICKGEECSGDIEEDGLEPYSELIFEIETNEDAKCKTSFTSFFEYHNIPEALPISWSSSSFSRNMTIKTTARPITNINEILATFTGFGSILSITQIEEIETLVTMQYSLLRDKAINYGADADDLDEAYLMFMNKTDMIREKVMRYKFYIDAALLSLSSSKMQIFIKCIDRAGNIQSNDFFIEFFVKTDTEQPILLSKDKLSPESYPYNISLFFNEPIECKFSEEDKSFSDMEYRMECLSNVFFAGNTGFECRYTLNEPLQSNKMYLRCLDQPKKKRDYYLKIIPSDSFRMKEDYPYIKISEPNLIKVEDIRFLQDAEENVIYSDKQRLRVQLNYHAEQDCKYKISSTPFIEENYYDDLDDRCGCNENRCTCELEIGSDENNYINYVCRIKRTNPRNEEGFIISIN